MNENDIIIYDPFGELLKMAEDMKKTQKEEGEKGEPTWNAITKESKA